MRWLAVVLVLVLAACGGDDESATTTTTEDETTTTTEEQDLGTVVIQLDLIDQSVPFQLRRQNDEPGSDCGVEDDRGPISGGTTISKVTVRDESGEIVGLGETFGGEFESVETVGESVVEIVCSTLIEAEIDGTPRFLDFELDYENSPVTLDFRIDTDEIGPSGVAQASVNLG